MGTSEETAIRVTPILVKRKDVEKMVGLSYPTILKLEKEGKFPKRRTLSESRVAWLYTDLVAWALALT